ncbi:hypothetical protein GIB67_025142 [Kingdonia uniflora]|uniref:VAL1-3 N-terminal zinc finger domain-containing protein n=1 Tax=Kingdonia uniflora TaxID=39325 RepID=A0A7J7N8R7_9MAGN|nr:hypothetical protein GIB67_025142 [Kingdonia uniflora]
MTSSSSSSTKICFNPYCKETVPERPRRGWRLRNGNYVELCDRCGFVYETGRFCESFHADDDGWRSCASCRKRLHSGCIVSTHAFVLLDAGGIDCMACARTNFIKASE